MEVTFLGVGEACDERYPNTSVLVRRAGRAVLLDCGFSVPGSFFTRVKSADELDAIWISHFHGDHFFGLPQLLLRLFESGRKKPLYFIGQSGIEDLVFQVMDLAYPSFSRKFEFELRFLIVDQGQELEALGFKWQGGKTRHSQRNLALGLNMDGCRLYYSGDGRPGSGNVELARESELMIHEGFLLEGQIHGHGSVQSCLAFAREARVKRLAVVHVQRDERRREEARLKRLLENVSYCRAFLPVPGDVCNI